MALLTQMDTSLSKLQEMVKDREAWCAAVHGVAKSQTQLRDGTAKAPYYVGYRSSPWNVHAECRNLSLMVFQLSLMFLVP